MLHYFPRVILLILSSFFLIYIGLGVGVLDKVFEVRLFMLRGFGACGGPSSLFCGFELFINEQRRITLGIKLVHL